MTAMNEKPQKCSGDITKPIPPCWAPGAKCPVSKDCWLSMVKSWAIWCFVIVDAAIFGYLYINLMLAYLS